MSFSTYLDDWSKGKRKLTNTIQYDINPHKNTLQECEILHRGVDPLDESVLCEENVSWVRDKNNDIHCVVIIQDCIQELNFRQIDQIWGERVRKDFFDIQKNVQQLPNGINVPIIPQFYLDAILEKKKIKEKRILNQQRYKKKILGELNRVLWFFNKDSEPTCEERHQSIFVLPPNIFEGRKTRKKRKRADGTKREQVCAILEKARAQVLKHPIHAGKLDDCCLDSINSLSDLRNLKIEQDGVEIGLASTVLSIYNFLIPKE